MAVPSVQHEGVARRDIALEVRGVGQLLARGRHGRRRRARGDRRRGHAIGAAEILGQGRMVVGPAAGQGEGVIHPPVKAGLHTIDARRWGVFDDGQAVGAKEGELELLPLFVIDRAVEMDRVLHPARFPTEFIVGKRVGRIGRERAGTIDAARTVARRIGGVDQTVSIDLVVQIDLMGFARAGLGFIQIDARRRVERLSGLAIHPAGASAGAITRIVVKAFGEAVKPEQAIDILIAPQAACDGQLVGDVVADFCESGPVAVSPHLVGQPDRITPTLHRQRKAA